RHLDDSVKSLLPFVPVNPVAPFVIPFPPQPAIPNVSCLTNSQALTAAFGESRGQLGNWGSVSWELGVISASGPRLRNPRRLHLLQRGRREVMLGEMVREQLECRGWRIGVLDEVGVGSADRSPLGHRLELENRIPVFAA